MSLTNYCWYQKTRLFLLPQSEDCVILSLFVWIEYQRVTDSLTDRRTDRQTDGIAVANYTALHCKQCGRAVKINKLQYLRNH